MRFAKNTQHDTSKVLRLPRKMAMDTSKVLRLPRKLQHIFWKRRKSIAPATQNDFRHVPEHVWMSRSATPATRNEATTRLKPPKITTSAELPIGTAIRSSRGRLRTVANGCGRLRSRTQRRANTPSTPRPPEWNGNPCYAFGKKEKIVLTDWKYGALKGRSSEPWAECIQYGIHLESPKDEKYVAKHLNRRYQSEFRCTVTLQGRRQNKQKRLWFVDASDARKFLVASLYPMKKLTDSNERLQALAAAESHFHATLRDMAEPPSDEATGSVSSSPAVPASALSQPASSEVPWLRSSGAAMGASRMRRQRQKRQAPTWPTN